MKLGQSFLLLAIVGAALAGAGLLLYPGFKPTSRETRASKRSRTVPALMPPPRSPGESPTNQAPRPSSQVPATLAQPAPATAHQSPGTRLSPADELERCLRTIRQRTANGVANVSADAGRIRRMAGGNPNSQSLVLEAFFKAENIHLINILGQAIGRHSSEEVRAELRRGLDPNESENRRVAAISALALRLRSADLAAIIALLSPDERSAGLRRYAVTVLRQSLASRQFPAEEERIKAALGQSSTKDKRPSIRQAAKNALSSPARNPHRHSARRKHQG